MNQKLKFGTVLLILQSFKSIFFSILYKCKTLKMVYSLFLVIIIVPRFF